MKKKKVMTAMSGGVDSSVAAHLMTQRGYDCIGAMMKLYDNDEVGVCNEKTCCSARDADDARAVAARVGMSFYVFNFKDDFEETVIKKFVQTYINGKTPNPCIDCNRYMKFERLMQRMYELGYDYVVTGHYARIAYDETSGRYRLYKAVDDTKDQSYVLYSLTQEQLAHTLFPLGEYRKTEIREIAEEQGFINARKHDSQDICFVVNGKYSDFIEQYREKTYPEGDFVDLEGNVLGRHKGIIRYTIGQRKGLGLSLKESMYVVAVDPEKNRVILGRNDDLFSREFVANDVNLIAVDHIEGEMRVKAKVRYRHEEQWATVTQPEPDKIRVVFDEPQRAITCGQAVVLYDGDVVVGGATIIETEIAKRYS